MMWWMIQARAGPELPLDQDPLAQDPLAQGHHLIQALSNLAHAFAPPLLTQSRIIMEPV